MHDAPVVLEKRLEQLDKAQQLAVILVLQGQVEPSEQDADIVLEQVRVAVPLNQLDTAKPAERKREREMRQDKTRNRWAMRLADKR